MTPHQIYVAVAIAAIVLILAVIGLVVGKRRKGKALTGLALAFVLAGLIFAGNRVVGYVLLGIGVVIAVVDLVRKLRGKAGDQSYV
jgi:hypothetical protein